MTDIIEISSSDEEILPKSMPRRRASSLSAIPFATPRSSCSTRSRGSDDHGVVESEVDRTHYRPRKPEPGLERARVRRIVYSSSSSDSDELPLNAGARRHSNADDVDVIEITDSSDGDDDPIGRKQQRQRRPSPSAARVDITLLPTPERRRDLFDDDSGLLVLNDPQSARRPLRRPQIPKVASPGLAADNDLVKAFSTLSSLTTLTDTDEERRVAGDDDDGHHPAPSPLFRARVRPLANVLDATPKKTPLKAKPKSTTPTKTPRTSSKRARAQAEQAERAAYAQSLFDELNRTVFAGGLSAETALLWNPRLLTTAGRARWHRSKEGVQTTSIELATKILDSKERIRNTLSHEMCHLACWTINQDPKEGHGKAWKLWAAKVMRKRLDIDISTRHNYEISYPYEWECENCAKTYGRFSKSIRPEEVVCGACKTGALRALFLVRSKRSTAKGRMTAASPRDSPRMAVPVGTTGMRIPGSFDWDDDEAEIDELVQGIREL